MSKRLYMSPGSILFDAFNYALLALATLSCLFPVIHVVAVSFSDAASAEANAVTIWPKGFNTYAYQMIFRDSLFTNAFFISVIRTVSGTALNMLLVILGAYPLSKTDRELKGRKIVSLYFLIPMMISGGLIPTFILVTRLHLINTLWSLILPSAVPIFYIIMMMNFFRGINKAILESAEIDGASEFTILARIVLPLSTASIASIVLFCVVGHWNEWFSGMIYLNDRYKYPLQTLLNEMMASIDFSNFTSSELLKVRRLSDRSFRSAQIIFATVPILCIYPFLQRYFITGITIGSVKG